MSALVLPAGTRLGEGVPDTVSVAIDVETELASLVAHCERG